MRQAFRNKDKQFGYQTKMGFHKEKRFLMLSSYSLPFLSGDICSDLPTEADRSEVKQTFHFVVLAINCPGRRAWE